MQTHCVALCKPQIKEGGLEGGLTASSFSLLMLLGNVLKEASHCASYPDLEAGTDGFISPVCLQAMQLVGQQVFALNGSSNILYDTTKAP